MHGIVEAMYGIVGNSDPSRVRNLRKMRNFWANFTDFDPEINIMKCKTEVELMSFAAIDNSKSVRITNSMFARKDICTQKTKFQNFGVNGFCQMTAEYFSEFINIEEKILL